MFQLEPNDVTDARNMRNRMVGHALYSKSKELKEISRYVLYTFYHVRSLYNAKTKKEIIFAFNVM